MNMHAPNATAVDFRAIIALMKRPRTTGEIAERLKIHPQTAASRSMPHHSP